LGRDRFERRAYRAIKDTLPAGSIVYPTNATPGVISALAGSPRRRRTGSGRCAEAGNRTARPSSGSRKRKIG
jgi:hypothetical protein